MDVGAAALLAGWVETVIRARLASVGGLEGYEEATPLRLDLASPHKRHKRSQTKPQPIGIVSSTQPATRCRPSQTSTQACPSRRARRCRSHHFTRADLPAPKHTHLPHHNTRSSARQHAAQPEPPRLRHCLRLHHHGFSPRRQRSHHRRMLLVRRL